MDRGIRPLIEGVRQDILPLIEARQATPLRALFLNLHPADLAGIIAGLGGEDEQQFVFALVDDPETASAVLVELPAPVREHLVENLPHDELFDLVEELDSNDAADLVQELPDELAAKVLLGIEPEDLAAVRPLLTYPEDSAGGIMATEVLTVPATGKISDARNLVRSETERSENFFYVYVVDPDGRLEGRLSLKDLVVQRSDTPVVEAMNREPVVVPPEMDQEDVAELFRRYDLLAAPVVGDDGRLLGRITVDDIVDVMREEAEEDIARMAGTDDEEFDESSVRRIAFLRLPWILISLVGGLLAGSVLRHFTGTLGLIALFLVAFVPVITAMGGNAGSQAAITMVRRLALKRFGAKEIVTIVFRESRVGMLLGVTCGSVVGLVAFLWRGEWYYGVVVGVAMSIAILVAATMGAVVPIIFHRLKVDPAIATGPFVSMSNDVVGLLIYFGLATLLLSAGGAPAP